MNSARIAFRRSEPLFVPYAIANLAGLFLHFYFVANIGRQVRLDHSHYYDAGDGLKYLFTGFPVLLVCLLINGLWGIKVLRNISRRKDYRALIALVVTGVLWVISFCGCYYMAHAAIQK